MKNLTVIYLLLFTLTIEAQDTIPCNCVKELNETFVSKLKGEVYNGDAGLVAGSEFNPAYVKGDIFLENKQVVCNQQIRYNSRIDGLLLSIPNSAKEILLDSYFIKGFSLKDFMGKTSLNFNKISVVKEFSSDSTQIFGQILYQSKLSLYVFRRYKVEKEIIVDVYNNMIQKKFYGPSFIYYFRLPNNRTIGFTSFKKRDLYKLFPENKELMRKIFREKHQLRFRNEGDLVRVTEILNSLF